ncbi:MAG: hypothetical protein JXO22_14705, partial [Phycisphaerae bacterium]|nr:hypothetical protein [Phycisphaerae bacterium]
MAGVHGHPASGVEVGTSGDSDAYYAAGYDYDPNSGRMDYASGPGLPTGGSGGVGYTYLAGSDLLSQVQIRNAGGAVVAWSRRAYESQRDVIDYVESNLGSTGSYATLSKYNYTNDAIARRTAVVTSGEAFGGSGNERFTTWGYDARNELTASRRYLGDDPNSADPNDPVLLRTVRYAYYSDGNVSNITVQDGDELKVKDLAFYYTENRAPWMMLWSEWGVDANGVYDPNDVYTMTAGREFRFNGPARFVSRDFNPNSEYHDFVGDQQWTDGADDYVMNTS